MLPPSGPGFSSRLYCCIFGIAAGTKTSAQLQVAAGDQRILHPHLEQRQTSKDKFEPVLRIGNSLFGVIDT